MLTCCPLYRFAARSTASQRKFRHARLSPCYTSFSFRQRSYTTALVERRQDDVDSSWADDRSVRQSTISDDSAYLDFLLQGYNRGEEAEEPPDTTVAATPHPVKSPWTPRRARVNRVARSPQRRAPITPVERTRIKARRTAFLAGRHLRPVPISIRSEVRTSAVFSSWWNTQLAKLSRRYDRAQPDYFCGDPQLLDFTPQAMERIQQVLSDMEAKSGAIVSIRAIARGHGMLEREIWSDTALWLLCYDKQKLMDFLLATHAPLYPPINWIEDCVLTLAKHYGHLPFLSGEGDAQSDTASDHQRAPFTRSAPQLLMERDRRFKQLINTFLLLLDRETKEQFMLWSGFIAHTLRHCTDAQVNEIWASIKLEKIKVSSNSMFHFSHYFAKHEQYARALDALLEAKAAGADANSVAFRSGCSTLLRQSSSQPGGFRVCLRLVEHLVGIGLKLNRQHYNIIMLNAIEAGDVETFSNIFRVSLEQDVKPDRYTCAIRLKACKLDSDNATLLREAIEDAIINGNIRNNQLLASEIIHCLALHHSKNNPETAFATVCSAYAQFFDPSPLQRLGVVLPQELRTTDGRPDTERMQPSRHVIAYMLWVYLNHNAALTEPPILYARWRGLVLAGDDEALADCATTPHFSNLFLQRFTRSKRTLLQAAQVVKDMQQPLPESAGVVQAAPDIYTWSIFLHGFASRGEIKLAEQVMTYMRSKGLEPNVVTWTSLLTGYAAKQDAEGLTDAIRRSEQSGTEWNQWTHAGVGRFRDKRRLRELLEKQRYEQSLDFSGELKGSLVEKISTVEEAEEDGAVADEGLVRAESVREGVASGKQQGFADSSAELAEMAGGVTSFG